MKKIFDKRAKQRNFITVDLVLYWDVRREAKGKCGKLDNLCMGPFQVSLFMDNNTYGLSHLDGELLGSLVNGGFLKRFF
jgi:hypothetical protein